MAFRIQHNEPNLFKIHMSSIIVNIVIELLSQATNDTITTELIDLLVFIPVHLTEALDTTAPLWHSFVPWLP